MIKVVTQHLWHRQQHRQMHHQQAVRRPRSKSKLQPRSRWNLNLLPEQLVCLRLCYNQTPRGQPRPRLRQQEPLWLEGPQMNPNHCRRRLSRQSRRLCTTLGVCFLAGRTYDGLVQSRLGVRCLLPCGLAPTLSQRSCPMIGRTQ